jgi:FkbM family methyltransferase
MAKVHVGSYEMRVPDDMLWAFAGGRYYEHNVTLWLDRMLTVESDPVFYDVGANYGYYTLRAAAAAAHVYAFEPVSETYGQLRSNIDQNDLQDVVAAYQVGLSDCPGIAEVNIYNSSGNNSMYLTTSSDPSVTRVGTETIELTTLDELIEAEGLSLPTILKMDIEGAELYALRGARNTIARSQPTLIVEFDEHAFADANYSKEDLLSELDRHGYTIFGLLADAYDSTLYPASEFAAVLVANLVALPQRVLPKLGAYVGRTPQFGKYQ